MEIDRHRHIFQVQELLPRPLYVAVLCGPSAAVRVWSNEEKEHYEVQSVGAKDLSAQDERCGLFLHVS